MASRQQSDRPSRTNDTTPRRTKHHWTRREFLNSAAVGVGALAAGTRAMAAPKSGRVLGANDRIRMGSIGSGGMGRHHMRAFKGENVDWVAVCDIYEHSLNEGLKIANTDNKGEPKFDPRNGAVSNGDVFF